jgi:F-type H+-transporting ATPase subunit a
MADPVLHIKDAYFFEVPKVLWPRDFKSKADVARVSTVWVELDDQFQDYEFHKQYKALKEAGVELPPEQQANHDWQAWVHPHDDHHGHDDHGHHSPNEGKPFDEFLAAKVEARKAQFAEWKKSELAKAKAERSDSARDLTYAEFKKSSAFTADPYDSFVDKMLLGTAEAQKEWKKQWEDIKLKAADVQGFVADTSEATQWSEQKLAAYSSNLSGKILIPQPFGRLRNLHEAESGITITKYMIVEVGVALIIAILFSWLARRVVSGGPPKGRLWNLLEVFVVFIRDQIAVPAIGDGHHDEHHDGAHGHGEHAAAPQGHHVDASGHAVLNAAHASHDPGHGAADHDHGHTHSKKGHAAHISPAKKFTPLLCSIFFFVLGCNLAGMLPWVGSPTAAFGVTLAMACVTLTTVFVSGMIQFGFFGFFANQVPSMDLPTSMAIILKPAIFLVEFGGLLIKHGVLAVRLLANILAGHLVLLAIMGLAFGANAAAQFIGENGEVGFSWWITATIAVVGCAVLSILELFVAFLQAFVFTMLSALFIGAAVHKH